MNPSDLVCFDTHVLIWGVKEQATEGQEHEIVKAKGFLHHLSQKGIRALLPSVVVAEFLTAIPADLHPMVNNLLERSFIIGSFDQRAAAQFAQIWQSQQKLGAVEEIKVSIGVGREGLKSDCMIVATAITGGASCIYSQDKGLKKFAEGHIRVFEIPEILEQSELFNS